MPNRQLIQRVLIEPPFRQKMVHQTNETVVVRGFQQVHHLMHDDIFQTFRRLFGQIGIESAPSGMVIGA